MEIFLNIKKKISYLKWVACKESVTENIQLETGLILVILWRDFNT